MSVSQRPGLTLPLAPGPSSDTGRGIVRLAPETMARLDLRAGETVALEGARKTHARLLPAAGADGRVWADAEVGANAGVNWGQHVRVAGADLPALSAARLGYTGPPPDATFLVSTLADVCLTEGDRLTLEQAGRSLRMEVLHTMPSPAGRVGRETRIDLAPTLVEAPRYPGVAGLADQIAAVHEMIELPLTRPDLFDRLGLVPPRGVLFTGPPGSGKTLLARAIAARTEAAFFNVAGPEILSKHYGESERALRDVFEAATRRSPAIVFLDELDAIAPRREALSGEKQVERRVVGQLLTLLDGLTPRDKVVVVAATNLPDALDPALRRPGRLEREIDFRPPDREARAEILSLHLARAPLAAGVDLPAIAARCHGFVGADLAALAREAGLAALARAREEAGSTDALRAETLQIKRSDLDAARRRIRPSALRADDRDTRPPRWSDIGGLEAAKTRLTEAVIWPMTQREALTSLRLGAPRGILLAGPPGTGKTLLARALAAEAGLNLLPMRPARLLSQFLGEAERALADAFARVRRAAPALLFFDEIDGLAPVRGRADASMDRVVAELLTQMDSLETNDGVTVIAATNRPDAVDPALTRPGRFDLVVNVDLPDASERQDVLAVHFRGRSVAPGLDLARIAQATDGASPADLAALATDAARRALSRWASEPEATRRSSVPRIEPPDIESAIDRLRARTRAFAGAAAPPPGNDGAAP